MRSPNTPNYILRLIFIILGITALVMIVLNEVALFFLLLLLLFLILLLWGLWEGEEERGNEGTDRPKGQREQPAYPLEEFYVQDQVIVRGPEAAVLNIVERFSDIVNPDPLRTIAFRGLGGELIRCIGRGSGINFEDFVINLYQLTGPEQDVADAIRAINNAAGRGGDVQAEPNWLTGHPWEPTGSPWEPTGSPWEPTGSAANSGKLASSNDFETQWAFDKINLPTSEEYQCGEGVTIGVFDTSPFNDRPTALASTVSLNNSYTNLLPPEDKDGSDLSSHGFFVSSLARKVAPNAKIEMIRVLNKHNKGNVYALLLALYDFTIQHNRFNPTDAASLGAVINMSLGIRILPEDVGKSLPSEVQALRLLLQLARCGGIMVVAAAGNNSANLPAPEAANLPANWPEVLGVAASTKRDGRACFSNQGNIGAPGGDGGPDGETGLACGSVTSDCLDGQCEYAVVGRIVEAGDPDQFGFWNGSSFATPMVAGLAACVIHLGRGRLSPDEVREIIECGADTEGVSTEVGGRRINVGSTLNLRSDCWERYHERLMDEEPEA